MKIAVVNRSTRVSDADAAKMASAWGIQSARDVAPAWGAAVGLFTFRKPGEVQPGEIVQVITDTPADPGVLGEHSVGADGQPDSEVCAGVVLDNGGTVLGDSFGMDHPATADYSVSSVGGHEAIELPGDAFVNTWWQGPMTAHGCLYAAELCDPVQDTFYEIDGVRVPNFILPAWSNPWHTPDMGPVDFLDVLKGRPFTKTPGGYFVIRDDAGNCTQVFGETVPGWMRELKRQSPRFASRIRAASTTKAGA